MLVDSWASHLWLRSAFIVIAAEVNAYHTLGTKVAKVVYEISYILKFVHSSVKCILC